MKKELFLFVFLSVFITLIDLGAQIRGAQIRYTVVNFGLNQPLIIDFSNRPTKLFLVCNWLGSYQKTEYRAKFSLFWRYCPVNKQENFIGRNSCSGQMGPFNHENGKSLKFWIHSKDCFWILDNKRGLSVRNKRGF